MDNLLALAILHSIGFTHKDLKKVFEISTHYSDFLENIIQTKRISPEWITLERKTKILEKLSSINIEKVTAIIKEKDIKIITLHDKEYPEKLATITQSPYLIYVRGKLKEKTKMLGIVGSRKSTNYGKKILEKIIPELISWDFGIVSGGAYGIDTISHKLSIDHLGYTISVFGSGVDIFYPKENTQLFEDIISHDGCLLSIFPIGARPEPYYFPIRNEMVAALSDGILIPEAGEKSGTLITASLALEHGRDVFAIPGDIFRETSLGTNQLIARGEAKCIQNAQGILEEYFKDTPKKVQELRQSIIWNSSEEEYVYQSITNGNNTPDSIGENSEYSIDTIMMTLSLMEISGHIELGGGGKYEIC